jgi:hypothetical protein
MLDPNPQVVRGEINYQRTRTAPDGARLEFWSEDATRTTMQNTPGTLVDVQDARPIRETLDLDTNGFVLADHRSALASFDLIRQNAVADRHYGHEMTELLTAVTGADLAVVVFDSKKRFGEAEVENLAANPNAEPARYPHADNTDASVHELLALVTDAIDVRSYERWAAYNLWRAVTDPPQDIPLAVCDARTITPADEATVTTVTKEWFGDSRHDTTGYCAGDTHRWYYFRDMTPQEVLVFKAHDSDARYASRVPHTAFDDPSCPTGVTTRASVETRAFAFWKTAR